MKTSTHLRKARALVNKGWCKGDFERVVEGKKCYCLTGAIMAIDSMSTVETVKLISEFTVPYHGPEYVLTPISFNDHPKTTKKDVLAVFDLAIKKAVEDERLASGK